MPDLFALLGLQPGYPALGVAGGRAQSVKLRAEAGPYGVARAQYRRRVVRDGPADELRDVVAGLDAVHQGAEHLRRALAFDARQERAYLGQAVDRQS